MPGRWPLFAILLSIVWQLILISEYFTTEDNTETRLEGIVIFVVNPELLGVIDLKAQSKFVFH